MSSPDSDYTGTEEETVVGVSKREVDAQEPSFDAALRDAYRNARMRHPNGPITLLLKETSVHGSNPISEYRVVLQVDLS